VVCDSGLHNTQVAFNDLILGGERRGVILFTVEYPRGDVEVLFEVDRRVLLKRSKGKKVEVLGRNGELNQRSNILD
jgi:hypothetical protein